MEYSFSITGLDSTHYWISLHINASSSLMGDLISPW